jgi:hypothetical protein
VTTAKPSAPVVGFNHNVKYGERVYHVQTEDSGLPHAHYITHLFVGGNIISSIKTSYAGKAEAPDLAKIVRSLMESQHKQMLKRLVAGEFQEQAAKFSAQHYEPGVLADGTNTASYVNTTPQTPTAKAPQAPRAAPPPPAVKPPEVRRPPPQLTPVARPVPPPPPQVITPAPPRIPGQPLPSVTRGPMAPAKPTAPPRMAQVVTPKPPTAPKPPVFSDGPVEMPHEDLPTLFAEELISEKSLDEVILAFLSADLDPPK